MNIPAYFICDAACWATYSLPGHTVGAVGDGEDSYFNETYGGEASDPSEVPAHFVKADTLEELAEKLGIDAAGLAAEIATFNENAAKGVDPVSIFGINPDRFKDILQDIALQFDGYIRTTFVADLDNVQLFPEHSSLDVLDLIVR